MAWFSQQNVTYTDTFNSRQHARGNGIIKQVAIFPALQRQNHIKVDETEIAPV